MFRDRVLVCSPVQNDFAVELNEGFEQVNSGHTHECRSKFNLECGCSCFIELFRPIFVVPDIQFADEQYIAANVDHDDQIGDHGHVDESKNPEQESLWVRIGWRR